MGPLDTGKYAAGSIKESPQAACGRDRTITTTAQEDRALRQSQVEFNNIDVRASTTDKHSPRPGWNFRCTIICHRASQQCAFACMARTHTAAGCWIETIDFREFKQGKIAVMSPNGLLLRANELYRA